VSLIDDLKGLEDRVAERMKELRPLVDEYRELEQVAQKLGVSPATAAAPTPRPRAAARKRSRARSTNSSRATRGPGASRARTAAPPAAEAAAAGTARARSNGRRDQLLDMVRARPGITVREVGSELGVDPTSLYRIVHRLEQDGALEKRGRELMPR
jgi:phage terminase small subunit